MEYLQYFFCHFLTLSLSLSLSLLQERAKAQKLVFKEHLRQPSLIDKQEVDESIEGTTPFEVIFFFLLLPPRIFIFHFRFFVPFFFCFCLSVLEKSEIPPSTLNLRFTPRPESKPLSGGENSDSTPSEKSKRLMDISQKRKSRQSD